MSHTKCFADDSNRLIQRGQTIYALVNPTIHTMFMHIRYAVLEAKVVAVHGKTRDYGNHRVCVTFAEDGFKHEYLADIDKLYYSKQAAIDKMTEIKKNDIQKIIDKGIDIK